jgi:hypothetical protein
MHRFLHEQSVSYRGKLIIPFIFGKADFQTIYSYALLEEQGHKSELHKAENPAELYSSNIEEIIDIAKRHLDERAEKGSERIFLKRYTTYQNNLIIVHQEAGKCFYDHYPPHELRNLASPKPFKTANECINWVKQGLDRNQKQVKQTD